MTVLSITTDFGNLNGFTGTMKGVIYGISPDVKIVDITHEIPAQDVRTGSIALWRAVPYFPAGSVHVAVVDPGVGTARRPIAAKLGDQFFVMPDNGFITPMLEDAEAAGEEIIIVHLDNPEYWLDTVYTTFHGRDIFAPAGAHLAAGVPITKLGTVIHDPIRKPLPKPQKTEQGYRANILVIDVFGNCSTNLRVAQVPNLAKTTLKIAGQSIHGIIPSYGHRAPGDLVAVTDSEGFVEVAVVNGSAARTFGIQLDDPVEVFFDE
ncbi:MAG TPA: SAM-dependent chlorinase/fluorinase [Anaerolineaceae bacterium]|nr:SAM-dependent chlorinase/fluorinase [Anaerolineaceae bacterium]